VLYVKRVAENDDIPALDVGIGQQVSRDSARRRVGELVHEEMISDQESVFHRTAGNHESLNE
jgi:hypothetical protein